MVHDNDQKALPDLAVSGVAQQNSFEDIKIEDHNRRNTFNGLVSEVYLTDYKIKRPGSKFGYLVGPYCSGPNLLSN